MTANNDADTSGTSAENTNFHHLFSPTAYLCAITDVGRIRDHNEDTFFVDVNSHVMIVADGMGGHAAGEVASSLAVEAVQVSLTDALSARSQPTTEDIKELLVKSFQDAHRTVLDAANASPECHGMGTALIAAWLIGDELYTCHVGDVRCYVRSGQRLDLITEDHSVVGNLERAGHLSREAARLHPERSIILQAVGDRYGIVPDVNHRALNSGDLVLLCSDGLWESMSEDDLAEILARDGSILQRAEILVERAKYEDGSDNITVVLYEHRKCSTNKDRLYGFYRKYLQRPSRTYLRTQLSC